MAEQTNQKAVTSNSREKGTVSSRFVTMEHSFFMPVIVAQRRGDVKRGMRCFLSFCRDFPTVCRNGWLTQGRFGGIIRP